MHRRLLLQPFSTSVPELLLPAMLHAKLPAAVDIGWQAALEGWLWLQAGCPGLTRGCTGLRQGQQAPHQMESIQTAI